MPLLTSSQFPFWLLLIIIVLLLLMANSGSSMTGPLTPSITPQTGGSKVASDVLDVDQDVARQGYVVPRPFAQKNVRAGWMNDAPAVAVEEAVQE
jgi:hypothetical protein